MCYAQIQTGVFPKSEEVQIQGSGFSPCLIQTKLSSRFQVEMSQKASILAADEMSTLHNHHVQFGSQQVPWLRSGEHGCTCGLQSFHGPQDPSVCSAPTPRGVHLRGRDGLSFCNTWTSSTLWTTSLNVFKWGLSVKHGDLHYFAGTLSS